MLYTFGDIVNYVNEGVRPIIEGDKLLQSDFLILCGYLNNKIFGLCLRSSTILLLTILNYYPSISSFV
jgi:hypothetical protein